LPDNVKSIRVEDVVFVIEKIIDWVENRFEIDL
jgi:hypothetical protein